MEIYFLLEQHFLVQSDCTFFALVLSSLSRIFATRNSAVNAEICYCYLVKKLPYVVRYLVLNKVIFE